MARRVYNVSPDGDAWKVQLAGSSTAIGRHNTKEAAVEAARSLALANQPSQVVVRRSDGTIQTEWTYGDDPYPPRG